MMNIYKTIFSFLLVCLFAATNANAAQVSQTELDREVMVISAKLRCAVCQNQPVSESNSGLAQDMRASIREQLQAGKSEAEIIEFFVARYGDYVLISPRQTGIGLPLWVLPPVLLLLISFFVFMVFKGGRNQPVPPVPELDEEDKQRVRRARESDSNREKG
jgi:cytochrome c-type biogenesis protein CcmH